MEVKQGFFVHKDYLKKSALPTTLDELKNLNWIGYSSENKYHVYCGKDYIEAIDIRPRVIVNDLSSAIDLVGEGHGVASLPIYYAQEKKNWIQLLPELHRAKRTAYLVYKERKYQPKVIALLIEALIKGATAFAVEKIG